MPAYTILFMRKDDPGRRPLTVHVSSGLFWTFIVLAVGLPICGFVASAGFLAPAWLKLNVKNMQQEVENAQQNMGPLQQQNTTLTTQAQKLQQQLQVERETRAGIEAKLTMAETARTEAGSRLTELESELVDLKRSVATYEHLLKPKLSRELLECVNIDIKPAGTAVDYQVNFAKVGKTTELPKSLTVQVRALSGDNAVTLGQSANQGFKTTQALNPATSLVLKGNLSANLPASANRLLDIKVLDGAETVASCWKMF
ncbi:MAG TPA: hypothetical protein VHP58_01885 [Alphaproteobacteria bacterium]|nr:hypothetical protein [Alphaproteobacteria bacterium]